MSHDVLFKTFFVGIQVSIFKLWSLNNGPIQSVKDYTRSVDPLF